jgi:hypothetical protein
VGEDTGIVINTPPIVLDTNVKFAMLESNAISKLRIWLLCAVRFFDASSYATAGFAKRYESATNVKFQ